MKPRILNPARLSFPLATALAALFSAAPSAFAATFTWDGGDTTDAGWSRAANWNATPSFNNQADIVFYATGAARLSTFLTSGRTIRSLTFNATADSDVTIRTTTTSAGTTAANLTFDTDTAGGNATITVNSGSTGDHTIGAGAGSIALNDHLAISHSGSGTLTLGRPVTGAFNVTKAGTGSLVMSGANTFTGQTIHSAGTLILNNATALGGNSPGVNGTLSVTMAADTTLQSNYIIADAGNVNSFVYAPITLTGTGTATFMIGAGNSTAPAEAVTFNLNGAIGGVAGTNVEFTTTSATLNNADSIFVLGAASTYNGNTTIGVGFNNDRINVKAGVANALPTSTVLSFENTTAGSGSGRINQYDLNGNDQTLAGLSNGGIVPNLRNFVVNNTGAPAALTINNTGNFTFGGATLSGSTTTNARIAGAIALTKDGPGTFTLGGTLTGGATVSNHGYTGATNILGGTLRLASSGVITASSGITINGSTAKLLQESATAISPTVTLTQGTLTGNGTVNTVNVGDNTGGIISNNDGVAGAALTVGALTFNGAATVNTFSSSASAAIVTTSLASNLAGSVTINPSAASWAAGVNDLISYGGGSIGGAGFSQFTLGTVTGLSPRQSSAFGNSGTAITLTVGADDPPFWAGDGDGKWNLGSTNNWKLSSDSSYTTFLTSDNVLFNDNATGAGPVAVDIDAANVAPLSTTFNNPTKDYVLSGAFGISSGSLTKSGSGGLTITNANSYTGNTTITGGVLDVSTDGAQLYSGANPVTAVVTVGSGGVLVVRNFAQTNTSGAGSPSLGNLNNTVGRVVIDGGTLRFNNENASRGRVISVGPNGATLDVVNNSNYVWTTSPGTSVPFTGSGQTLTLTGDATSTGQINLVIGGTDVSLVKSGDATWTLGGTNTYTGNTTITGGTLAMAGNKITGSPTISIGNGATLRSTAAFTLAAGQDITGTGTTGFVTMSPAGSNGFVTTSGTDISASGTLTFSRLDVRGAGNVISSGAIQSGGAASNQRGLLVGNTVTGDLTLNSGASLTTGASGANSQDLLGNGTATGTFIINGGTYTNTSGLATLQLGNAGSNGSGTLTLTSGSANIGTIAYQAGTGDGIVNLDGGTLTVGSIIDSSGASKIFNFNGGQFISGAGVTFPANVTANVKNGGALFDTNGFSATIESALVNFEGTSTGGLTKSGLGTLTLSGVNTYAGGTSVNGGKLRFSTAAASATDVTVAGGAEAGALVAVNDGQWVNTGDLALQNSGAVLVDYGSTTPSTTVAPVSVTDFTFGTTPGVRLAGSAIASLAVSQSYPLVTWSGSGPVDGSAFTLLTHRLSGTFSVASNTLSLTVTNNAADAPISWNTGNGNWDVSSINWVDGNLAATTYFDTLDTVVFGDAAGVSGSPVVTLATTVSPLNVTMNSTARNYTVSGAGSISGSGGLTLSGTNTGTFTLATANNTFSGGTSVLGGTLALGHATDTLPDSGAVTVDGTSAVLSLGANNDTVGVVSLKNGASITGSGGTLTGTSYALESGNVLAILGGSGSLTKTTAGTLTLSAANTYTGSTTVSEGTLVLANTGALQGTTGSVGLAIGTTLQLSTDTAFTTLPLFGATSGASAITFISDRATAGAGLTHVLGTPNFGANTFNFTSGANVTSGTVGISFDGLGMTSGNAGTVVLNPTTATVTITGGVTSQASNVARTLQLDGTGTGHSIGGVITQSVANALSLTKSNTSTWTLSGANTYNGATTIDQGTLAFSTTDQSLTGGLTFGATAGSPNNGTLDLSTVSATFTGAALVRTNSATANTITLGVGETLTLNGGLTVGYDSGSLPATATKLTVDGGGSLVVNGTAVTIGQGLAANNQAWYNTGTLDVTSLASFNANVTNFNLGVGVTNGTGSNGILLLSNTANTLIATTLKVGDTLTENGGQGNTTLTLGTGINAIQADTIEIGKGKPSGPDGYRVRFASQTAGSPGTVTIANKAGSGAATINIANMGSTGTGGNVVASLDLRGHDSTVNASTLLIANSTATSGTNVSGSNGTVHFDTGTFTVGTLNMAFKSGNSTGTARGTVNVGGGDFTVNTAFTLGTHSGAGASVATMNLTGGTFTSNVNILKGSSTANGTINLSGGTLDLNGNAIGSGSAAITLNAESGTLRDVATINGTGGLTKTTAGTLIVEGTDPYSGDTTVTEGTLTLSNAAGALNANTINDASTVTIASTGATLNLAYTGTDLVDKLFIGAGQLAAGTYGKMGSLSPVIGIPQITGDGTLTVASGSNFGTWITGTFANGAVPGGQQGPNQDPDNDGIPNLVEYAIAGQDPTVSNASVGTVTGTSLSFDKRQPLASDIAYAIIESADLGISDLWEEVPVGPEYTNNSTTISYTFTPGTPVKDFFRLKVIQVP